MSYDVYIIDREGNVLNDTSPQITRGGTYSLGDSGRAELNITYNYSGLICAALAKDSGLRSLDGRMCRDTINDLVQAIMILDDNVHDDDDWVATEGNARLALTQLLLMALHNPYGYWNIV